MVALAILSGILHITSFAVILYLIYIRVHKIPFPLSKHLIFKDDILKMSLLGLIPIVNVALFTIVLGYAIVLLIDELITEGYDWLTKED